MLPMLTESRFWWVMLGLFVGLSIVSVVAKRLALRESPEKQAAVIDNVKARMRAWWRMIILFGVCMLLGRIAILLLFAFASFWALREFISLIPAHEGDYLVLRLCFYIAIPLQYILIAINEYSLFLGLLPVLGFLALSVATALSGGTREFLVRTSVIQWGVILAVYCLSFVPAVLFLQGTDYRQQGLLVLYLMVVVQMSDVLQYVFGKWLGKHRLVPSISPSKTVEGLLGGGLAAVALGACLWRLTPFSVAESAGVSALIVAAGFFGGLVSSAVKRSLGAKDWGQMIEGHGGVLDRLDSITFSAPIFFLIVDHLARSHAVAEASLRF